jgi:hypothetical protein
MTIQRNSLLKLYIGLNKDDRLSQKKIACLIKFSNVNIPVEEIDIDGVDSAISHLNDNPGQALYLDNPMGTRKRFGKDLYLEMPFHYGEVVTMNNPSDDMGWDIIIIPSACEGNVEEIGFGHDLVPIGYVPVNPDEKIWEEKTREEGAIKSPPIGNDKIILAPLGSINISEDVEIIENFFDTLWQFANVIWI